MEPAAAGIEAPWLLVHGTEDDVVLITSGDGTSTPPLKNRFTSLNPSMMAVRAFGRAPVRVTVTGDDAGFHYAFD